MGVLLMTDLTGQGNPTLFCQKLANRLNWLCPVRSALRRTPHRGAICQFLFRWVFYYHNSKSTGKKTGKTHLCAPVCNFNYFSIIFYYIISIIYPKIGDLFYLAQISELSHSVLKRPQKSNKKN